MDLDEYRRRYNDEAAAPGWDAIDAPLRAIHGDQEPKHWGTIIKNMMGGPDPLDGISAYQCSEGGLDSFSDTTHTAEELVEHHRKRNPLLVTDLSRKSE